MRSPTDLPKRRRRSARTRVGIIVAVFAVFLILTSLRSVAGFYTDYLWFKEVHFTSVFRGVLGTEVFLAVLFTLIFFALLFGSLTIADRIAPRFRAMGPEDELVQRYRDVIGPHAGKVRFAIAALFALLIGVGTSSHWNDFILFRNHASFGIKDPQFHKDIGFFTFQLPFIKFVADWLFVAIVVTTIITVIGHYLNGGIRLQAQGQRVTPQVKVHISVLLAMLALVKAVQYYLDRYELDLATSHVVDGATYTAVHAQLPAKNLLIVISIFAALLFVANIRAKGWTLPVIAVALWGLVGLLVGVAYPAFIQKVKVEPNEAVREEPYIKRNISATRAAFKIGDVKTQAYQANPTLTAGDLQKNAQTIQNVRLWDPSPSISGLTYQKLQEIRSFYQFSDVDIDRYSLNGQLTQTLASVRELNPGGIPDPTWVNRHLQFTHGYGAVLAPANAVSTDGKPAFDISEIPPQIQQGSGAPEITEPRIYYGEGQGSKDYAIVKTNQKELDFQDANGNNKETDYGGTGGVGVGSLSRQLLFALRFGDFNFITSSLINSNSRVIYVRNIQDRVRKAAPFLRYDSDPYAVILDNGHIAYVQDAYTVTSRYPYSQQVDHSRIPSNGGLSNVDFNYVRNSVKVVIDAYNGTMSFFVFDSTDPVLKTYEKAFPKLFTDRSQANQLFPGIINHLRYPEDLFRAQTNMFGRYHITDAKNFYSKSDAWEISQDPGSGELSTQGVPTQTINPQTGQPQAVRQQRMDPTYLLMRLPGDPTESFLILQPFVPFSTDDKQQNLAAFLTASSDPDDYGTMQAFVTPPGQFIDGPAIVNSRIKQTPAISQQLSLLNVQGSKVVLGNVLVIPIEQSLLYVQPLYVKADQNPLPQLKKVILVSGNQAVMFDTFKDALSSVTGGPPPSTLEQQPNGPSNGGTSPPTTAPPNAGQTQTVSALLDQAQADFVAADAALRAGDLAGFQQKYKDGVTAVQQADAVGKAAAGGSGGSGSGAGGGGGAPASTTTTTAAGGSA